MQQLSYEEQSACFHALGNINRYKIMNLLKDAPEKVLCVDEIEKAIPNLAQPTISHHLSTLRRANLIYLAERRGQFHYYAINTQTIDQIGSQLDTWKDQKGEEGQGQKFLANYELTKRSGKREAYAVV